MAGSSSRHGIHFLLRGSPPRRDGMTRERERGREREVLPYVFAGKAHVGRSPERLSDSHRPHAGSSKWELSRSSGDDLAF